jgi:GDP-mannose 6-dehydrogenase
MRISVFGIGYVGAVSSACLAAEGHVVTAVDIAMSKVKALNDGRAPIVEAGLDRLVATTVEEHRLSATTDVAAAVAETDVSVICVGTPSTSNGNLDLSHVVRVCEEIGQALRAKWDHHTVIVRSTLLPGSMRRVVIPVLERNAGKRAGQGFGVAFYPEFLREGSAIRDYHEAATVVLGVEDDESEKVLRSLVERSARGAIVVADYGTAEAVKYASNAWHAAKIVFANEIGRFCNANDIDSQRVMEILCADKRLNVSPAYLRPGFAYGGSCLPKDLRALLYQAKQKDVSLPMLESLPMSNDLQIRRVFNMVQELGRRRIGLIGLSFKNGTDDMRESPAVELAELLFGKGYRLRIFDHNVSLSKLMGSNLSFIQARIPHLAELLTTDLSSVFSNGDTIIVATSEFGGSPLPRLREDQVLIDLVRLNDKLRPSGGTYQRLC